MFAAAVAGFALGLSLILAIGAQNAFVLRQGLRREHVFAVCLACALSDAILIVAGVAGFSALSQMAPGFAPLMRWGGAAFLVVYGALSFKAAIGSSEALKPSIEGAGPLGKALASCLALTWLNPHVYLDTFVLLGSVSTQYGGREFAFGSGAATASFTFFFSLGYGAALLRPLFSKPVSWRVLEAVIGLTMWAIALKLILG